MRPRSDPVRGVELHCIIYARAGVRSNLLQTLCYAILQFTEFYIIICARVADPMLCFCSCYNVYASYAECAVYVVCVVYVVYAVRAVCVVYGVYAAYVYMLHLLYMLCMSQMWYMLCMVCMLDMVYHVRTP